ncbi:hypothetical protein KPL37_13015 [Clostridium frigoris]|uniref:Bacteriophage holin of superfamily 6 (Holin_LLH) n=1 Tax=Clostridium frigoris TaxID=205327 RepID=A0ABS6BUR9_9CLOT|nr:hypothetical protein [Clostridium frigoris]MBU3160666.1 hypothetical protein [Clostridium frigoris]
MNDFLSIFYPILFTFLTGFLAYVGKEVLKFAPKVAEYWVAKIGLTNYQETKAIAWDIWNVVEEHCRLSQVVGDKVQVKVTMFETLIKQKVPGITNAEIEIIRQSIAGEFNKNKPLIINATEKNIQQPYQHQ